MLTPTFNCNSPPFLIKIKSWAKKHLYIPMLIGMQYYNFKKNSPIVFAFTKIRDA